MTYAPRSPIVMDALQMNRVRLRLARISWWLSARFLSLGYRFAMGMPYREYLGRDLRKGRGG